MEEKQKMSEPTKPALVPVMNIRMMSDEEWNKLAYKNWLERKGA